MEASTVELEQQLATVASAQLPLDEIEFRQAAPDDAPLDGAGATPGLPLESARTPDPEVPGTVSLEEFGFSTEQTGGQQHISVGGLHLVESFEGFSPTPYDDGGGVMTIGYGTTAADVSPLPHELSRAAAETLLRRKLAEKYEPAVRGLGVPLNQHQFDALCSFVYNLGPGSMSAGWTIGRLLRAREYRQAAEAMLMYDRVNGVVWGGLARRRQAERALFLEPVPAAADPHHLQWFSPNTWVIDGTRIPERGTVAEFYRLVAHRGQSERQLHVLLREIVLLRKRVWTVAHQDPRHATWGLAHRGFRWRTLLELSREPL